MYKVLLVDDENLVIKSLESGVDWKKSGFYVVGKANNGAEALQSVAELKPHVVFTDIRMPGISGLELIKKIKEIDNNIQFIVISGYAEFAYVQKSLSYGVLGYCLKPFDDHEIDALLKTAAKNLNEIKQKNYVYLLDLLEDASTENNQSAVNKIFYQEGLTEAPLYVLVSLGKGRLHFADDEKTIAINVGSARYAYFVQHPYKNFSGSPHALAIPDGILGIGTVKSDLAISSLMKNIEVATVRAWDFFIHGRTSVFYENDNMNDEKANQLVKQLEKAIMKKDTTTLGKLLDEMLLPENRDCLSILHALKIYNTVYFHAFTDHPNRPEEDYIFSKEQLYHLFHNFDSMISSLKESLNPLEEPHLLQTKKGTKNANLMKILQYIDESYRRDISIQSISKDFFLNPNYLSQLFKRELHLTFTEYLTKVRLQEAKKLLLNTEQSIAEIAETIGYRDYFYFIRLFKKYTNQTPRQYKQRDPSAASHSIPSERLEE